MIRWRNEQTSLAYKTAAALCRMISENKVQTKAVAKYLGQTEEQISEWLTETPEHLTTDHLVGLFKKYTLSPLFLISEMGEPAIYAEDESGRMLEALNHLIAQNRIMSLPEYYRLLNVSSTKEYIHLSQGRIQLTARTIINLCGTYDINPVYVYKPVAQTPMFL